MKRQVESHDEVKLEKRICAHCKREFQPIRYWQQWCKAKCRELYYRNVKRREAIKLHDELEMTAASPRAS